MDGLIATGELRKRLDVIEQNFPDFFTGDLLDVGCNKGFFELYHRGPVTGIDMIEKYVDLCRDLRPDGEFQHCSFGKFETDRTFDRIFIGNGPHYPFIEYGGWSWVEKLARLSVGQILLEGPTGMEGRDAKNCIPPEIASEFTRSKMREAFKPQFFFIKEVPSPLVDRYFSLFVKKDELVHAPMARYADYLKIVYLKAAHYTRPTDTVMEICTRHDRGIMGERMLPHSAYIMVDRNPSRPGLNLDAVNGDLPECDVTISTAILHHTEPNDIAKLFANIARHTRRTIILSGPDANTPQDLIGDHRYHIDAEEISSIAKSLGWQVSAVQPCGLSKPYVELFMVFEK